jgi:hypothetical protein
MTALGNLFTHYQYHTVDITQRNANGRLTIQSHQADFNVAVAPLGSEVLLPAQSPFATWQEARRFAGPLPFTFSTDAGSDRVLIVEGIRQHWEPQPVAIESHHVGFFDQLNFSQLILANAFALRDVPYHWKKGRLERWSH